MSGFSFGTPSQTPASTQFGIGSGSTPFGTTATTQSNFSFGQPSTTGFSSFGGATQPQTQQQPATQFGLGSSGGSTFGAPTSTASAFSFGQPSSAFSFGGGTQQQQQQPQATATPFGISSSAPATSQASTFSFGQPSTTGFSFGGATQPQTQQQPATQFGLGSTSFGTTTTSAPSTFSFGQPSTGFSFGGGQTQQPAVSTSFGLGSGTSAFGAPAATSSTFSFGKPSFATQPSLFGQPQTQQQSLQLIQQQQPQIDEAQAFQQSIFQCHRFGDERDSTLAGLNYLQACWGAGKGYYSQALAPANFTQQNPFYRFKAVGYAFMYTDSNEDGQVVINFKKPHDKLNAEESNIISSIQQMLARPNILIRFTGTKAISEDATMAIIFAEDKNTLRRVPATDMAAALCQPHLKPQLENLGVTNVNPKVKPSPEQLKRYLETPPDGIDPRVWTQAQEDNPDPTSMIPTPLIGVEALKSRIEWQEKETQQHHARLKLIGESVTTLLNRHANMAAELQQMKRKHVLLNHRLISIICRQELMRKQGTTLQPEEEMLKKKLEEMDAELNSPTQYKGRLNELLSQIRLHKSTADNRPLAKFNVDPTTLTPVKDFLAIQQESVKHLVATTKTDSEVLKEMLDELTKMTNKIAN